MCVSTDRPLCAAPAQMPIALAGGVRATILSIVGLELLPFFSTPEACTLRLVCREFVGAIADVRWNDMTRIRGDLSKWRACFPRARAANVCSRRDLVDADFVHLAGLHTLDMSNCRQDTITDAAFAHLRDIHTLDMWGCSQSTINDAAFAHLRGIHTLHMRWCEQRTITDAAFSHLRGIHTLDMRNCSQATITDAAFAHLLGIHTLSMKGCRAAAKTAARALGLNVETEGDYEDDDEDNDGWY